MPQGEKQIQVRSMFGHHTQRGLVILKIQEEMAQMTPLKAREIAAMLWEAADAAEGDQFLMHFAQEQIGLTEIEGARLLKSFREDREKWFRHDQEEMGLPARSQPIPEEDDDAEA